MSNHIEKLAAELGVHPDRLKAIAREVLGGGDIQAEGVYTISHFRNGELIHKSVKKNLLNTGALSDVLNRYFLSGSFWGGFYVGIYLNQYAPQATDTIATFPTLAVANEFTAYNEATRPQFVANATSTGVLTASSSAQFTISSSVTTLTTIYGAFLSTNPGKGNTTGQLVSATLFDEARQVKTGDVFAVDWTCTLTNTGS